MTRRGFKIRAIVSLIALVVVAFEKVEPDLFKSLHINLIAGVSFGILAGNMLLFTMLAFGEIEILDKEE